MSRHGKLAVDSARLNIIVPKTMKERIAAARDAARCVSTSDTARVCLELGLQRIESSMIREAKA